MAITYNQTLAQARLQKVIDAIDAGGSFGVLVIGTSALAGGAGGTLVTFTFSKPCATLSVRTLTFSGTPKTSTATAGGIAAKAEVRVSDGTVVANGLTVGDIGSAADIIVDTTAIVNGRTVFLLSAAVVHP